MPKFLISTLYLIRYPFPLYFRSAGPYLCCSSHQGVLIKELSKWFTQTPP